jgi:hypothetical protein
MVSTVTELLVKEMPLAMREGLVVPRIDENVYGKIWPMAKAPASAAKRVLHVTYMIMPDIVRRSKSPKEVWRDVCRFLAYLALITHSDYPIHFF